MSRDTRPALVAVDQAGILLGRHLRHLRRTPERVLGSTLLPVAYVVLFGVLFGSAMRVPGGDYQSYLMAGILAQTMLSAMQATAQGVAGDLRDGMVDRLRSMCLWAGSVIAARVTSNVLLGVVSTALMSLVGVLLGWRVQAGVPRVLAAFAVLVLLGVVMALLGMLLGTAVRDPEAIGSWSALLILPITFLSNAFIPVDGLPGWLRAVCEWNPFSTVVSAVRTLFGNQQATPAGAAWPLQHATVAAPLLLGLLLIVLAPTAVGLYRRRVGH